MSKLTVCSRRAVCLLVATLSTVGAGSVLLTSACEVEPEAPEPDRQDVLRELSANVIVATYVDLASSTQQLAAATTALRAAPSAATLASAQQLYRSARTQQKMSEAYHFGPADDLLVTGGAIDAWPADGAQLEALIQGSGALTPSDVGRLGGNQRGFPALEQLLFDSSVGDAEVLARLTAAGSGARRLELGESLAIDLAAVTRKVADGFSGPGGYGFELAEAGAGSKTLATQSLGIDKVVTGLVYCAELMVMKKLAKPLGTDTNNVVDPKLEEGPRSDSTLADLKANLLGIKAIYKGVNGARAGKGLAEPVRAMNAGAAMRFEQALEAALAAVDAVPPPFRTALVTNRAPIDTAYQAIRAVKSAIQTELAGALGASIGFGFSDTD
jgi:putative iron-regulated protein